MLPTQAVGSGYQMRVHYIMCALHYGLEWVRKGLSMLKTEGGAPAVDRFQMLLSDKLKEPGVIVL